MKKDIEMKINVFDEEFAVKETAETGCELEQLYDKLYEKVYKEFHLGATIEKSNIDGWPAIHVEDPDTQTTIPVSINGMNHFT